MKTKRISREFLMNNFTGVQVVHVSPEAIVELYQKRTMSLSALSEYMLGAEECAALGVPLPWTGWMKYLNLTLVLTAYYMGEKTTALARISHKGDEIWLLKDYVKNPIYGLKPKNKEQGMLLNTLMDDRISCQVIVGRAGSGKTICALAYALHQLFERKSGPYEKIILTRPMSSVGDKMGAFPGEANEKLAPYLGNFYDNLEQLMGRNGRAYLESAMTKGHIEIMPIQLIGGSSWHNSIVIADEVQSLTHEQMYALGTRPANGTKLILMGDYRQRYGTRCAVEQTGLYKVVNSEAAKKSPVMASIELLKTERSELAKTFNEIFEGDS
jgi:PhoH-like ATPase